MIGPNPNAHFASQGLNHCPGWLWEPVASETMGFDFAFRKEGSMLMAKGKMGERVSEDAQLKLNDLVVDYGYKAAATGDPNGSEEFGSPSSHQKPPR